MGYRCQEYCLPTTERQKKQKHLAGWGEQQNIYENKQENGFRKTSERVAVANYRLRKMRRRWQRRLSTTTSIYSVSIVASTKSKTFSGEACVSKAVPPLLRTGSIVFLAFKGNYAAISNVSYARTTEELGIWTRKMRGKPTVSARNTYACCRRSLSEIVSSCSTWIVFLCIPTIK